MNDKFEQVRRKVGFMKFKRLIAGAMASVLTFTVIPFAEYSTFAVEIDTNDIIDEMVMPDETVMPDEMAMPDETVMSDEMAIPDETVTSDEIVMFAETANMAEAEYTVTISGIEVYYDFLDDGTIEIKGVKSQPATSVDLTIPAKIDGTAVTSIGESAFKGIKGITSLTISEGIQKINKYAFMDCDDIVSISIPSTVTYINTYAFSVINNLKHITVSEKNKKYTAIDDVLFSYKSDGKSFYGILCYPMQKTDLSVYNIPDGVQYINNYCFAANTSLKSVHIPNTVTDIYSCSFRGCKSLSVVRVPESVSFVGIFTFEYIENLKVKILNPECSFEIIDSIEEDPIFDSTDVIYGKEGSTAQTYAQQAGINFIAKPFFTFGVDNLNFINSNGGFGLNSDATHADSFTDKELLSAFKNNISNTDYNAIFRDYTMLNGDVDKGVINETWNGACQGMAAIVILSKKGLVNYSDFKSGATSAYTMGSAKSNPKLRSLMEYYYLLQYTRPMEYYIISKENKSAINSIKQLIDKDDLALIGVKKKGSGGHAIVGYDYEEGISKTIRGVTYDGCIYIWDPNYSTSYNEKCNIYYNTKTYEWAIDCYEKYDVINSHVSDISLINYKGYIDYPEAVEPDTSYGRIEIRNNDSKIKIQQIKSAEDGKNSVFPINDVGFAQFVNEPYTYEQYTFNFEEIGSYDLYAEDVNVTLLAASESSDYAHFDMIEQSVTIKNSKPTKYRVSITTNDEITYEKEAFTYEITGDGAVEVTMTKAANGFYLEADDLSNVSVKAWNQKYELEAPLKLDENVTKVYIYQKEGTLYSTNIMGQPTYILGDANEDGTVNIADAVILQKWLLGMGDLPNWEIVDLCKDGKIDIFDMIEMRKLVIDSKSAA